MEQLTRELTYAAGVLRRSPGVSLLSVLTMGVGIGVSVILFAITSLLVLAAIAGIGLVATLIPDWRATRIDAVAILRRG